MDQMDIADIIGKLSQTPPHGSVYQRQVKVLFQHFAAHNIPLATARDHQHLNMAEATARKYAREFKLAFSDYVPMELRPKKEKKAKAPKIAKAA